MIAFLYKKFDQLRKDDIDSDAEMGGTVGLALQDEIISKKILRLENF